MNFAMAIATPAPVNEDRITVLSVMTRFSYDENAIFCDSVYQLTKKTMICFRDMNCEQMLKNAGNGTLKIESKGLTIYS